MFKDLPVLGPYRYEDGSTYLGQYKNGLRHGEGRQIFTDGSLYEGFWRYDKVDMKGRMISKVGDFYEGDIEF